MLQPFAPLCCCRRGLTPVAGDAVHRAKTARCLDSTLAFLLAPLRVASRSFSCVSDAAVGRDENVCVLEGVFGERHISSKRVLTLGKNS